jgi:hypothetical protein
MEASNRQEKYATSCRRIGKMAVITRCGACHRPIIGVIVREHPGHYCIECKDCGFSARSHFSDDHSPADGGNKA